MIYKYSAIVILIIAFIYGSFWTFNHIDAWLGIVVFIVGGVYLINQLLNLKNKQK